MFRPLSLLLLDDVEADQAAVGMAHAHRLAAQLLALAAALERAGDGAARIRHAER